MTYRKNDFKVGQVVYIVKDEQIDKAVPYSGTIVKIGRKYVTVSYGKGVWQEVQFDMTNDMKEVTEYARCWLFFVNESDYQIYAKKKKMVKEIRKFNNWEEMTISQIHSVMFQIDEYKKLMEMKEA